MKSLILVPLLMFSSCTDLGHEVAQVKPDDVKDFRGVIVKAGSDSYVINSDPMLGSFVGFYPLNLPEEFKVRGLLVLVSGRFEPTPPGISGLGLWITSIKARN